MMEKVGGRGRVILMGSTKNGNTVGVDVKIRIEQRKGEGNNFSCCLCFSICL